MLPDLPFEDEMRISTRRLDLVPLTAADADDLFPLLQDPALGRFTGETPPANVEEFRSGFARWEARRFPNGAELWLNWAVRRRDDGRAIGYVQSTVGDGVAAIAWLRDTLGVLSIVGSVHPDNIVSQTAAHRIGLRPTDRHHEGEVVWENVPPDEIGSGSASDSPTTSIRSSLAMA